MTAASVTAVSMAGQHRPPATLHVLVPFWGLAGGVIKVLDYAHHALAIGVPKVVLWAPPLPVDTAPVMDLPVVGQLVESAQVEIRLIDDLSGDPDDDESWLLFTEPTHHPLIEQRFGESFGHRLIHLVQGTRHANPSWSEGRNYRLLHRPMSRIAVSDQVATAINPVRNTRFPMRTIVEGHDVDYFSSGAPVRSGQRAAFRVVYTTWKSDLGDRVAAAFASEPLISFEAIRGECGWPELRRRYHAADIFLCSPGPEEGFYLPGLEAMAAGCAVVSSFVGGNEAYAHDGANMLRAEFDDVESHVRSLRRLVAEPNLRNTLANGARRTTASHTLEREAEEFGVFMAELAELSSTAEVA